MSSRIYSGTLQHARFSPRAHKFNYKVNYWCVDLDELGELDFKFPIFSRNRLNLASIHDRDYLSGTSRDLRSRLNDLLERFGVQKAKAKVELLTLPRVLGFAFNPASFFICYDLNNKPESIVLEINNTFAERHVYIFERENAEEINGSLQFRVNKNFHVSPFFKREGEYQMRFKIADDAIDIAMNLQQSGKVVFSSRLKLLAIKDTSQAGNLDLVATLFDSVLTLPRIYFQAVILFFVRRLKVIPKPNPADAATILAEPCSWSQSLARYFVRRRLRKLERGELLLRYPDGREELYGGREQGIRCELQLHNFKPFMRLLRDGGIGFGEGFVAGDWNSPNLSALLTMIFNNFHVFEEQHLNLLKPMRLLHRFWHWMRDNSRFGSQKNIRKHYDLGNRLFSLFLDESMTYSSAIYSHSGESLESAQRRKVRRMLEKAMLEESDRVLEIGSGWGTLAIEAARKGCQVTSITLSREQLALARERAIKEEVESKVKFELCDYRDMRGQFDKIVSVEMLEAVGHRHLGTFFKSCERLLAPDGLVVLQVITFPDFQYHDYLKRCDWIQKHIFPGSHLPALSALLESVRDNSKLIVESVENIGPHYALTLAEWRTRFSAQREKLESLGYDQEFQRMWEFYLASCEAEFGSRWLNVLQIVLTRPNNQRLIATDRARMERGLNSNLRLVGT